MSRNKNATSEPLVAIVTFLYNGEKYIAEMVSLAEKNPSIGIVGSYILEGVRIKCDGLPYPNSVFSGRDICRWTLLGKSPVNGGLYVFGSPTTLLIRSDLTRSRKPFYNDRYHQVVDQEACYYLLQNSDFGFVHQILTFSRLHAKSVTSSIAPLNRRILEELMLLVEYWSVYLSQNDYAKRLSQRMDNYYSFLAASIFERKPKDFWQFHREGIKCLGLQFSKRKMAIAALRKFVRRLLVFSAHPIESFHTKTGPLKRIER